MKTLVKQETTVLKKKSIWSKMASQWELYVFLLPAMIFLFVFAYGPMYGLMLAFKDYSPMKGIWGSPWVGFEHFIRFFTLPSCREIIWNTVQISLFLTLFSFPIPIVFALLLHQVDCKWFKKTVQNATYIPYMFSVVIIISIAQIFCSPTSGVLNIIGEALGGERINFFADEKYVFPIYFVTSIWQTMGYSAVIYLAALSGIDMEQMEAAKIDGANRFRIIWNIELPAIAETVIIMLIMNFGNVFTVSADKMLLMQNSANLGASEVLTTYVYKVGLIDGQFGFSTAVNLFNTLVNVVCVLIVNKIAGAVSDTSLF